jgi:hypothetical protein
VIRSTSLTSSSELFELWLQYSDIYFEYSCSVSESGCAIIIDFTDPSLSVRRSNEKLICSAGGFNSSVELSWNELHAENKLYNESEFIICDAVSFQLWKQNASNDSVDLEFQCNAFDGQRIWKTNYTVNASELNEVIGLCSVTRLPTGNARVLGRMERNYFNTCILIDCTEQSA